MKAKAVGVFVFALLLGLFSERVHSKDRLVIGYTAITGIKAGLWVAEDAGIFDKHNIQAELLLVTSASKMVQAMLGGDVPFAAAGGNAAVDANLSGADMVMLGVLAKVPAFYIMALPEIKTIEDLRGKPVGVTRFGSSTDFTMRYLLRKHGLNPDRDVTMIQAGDLNAAAAMLKTKAIFAAPFSSPANLRAQETGARSLLNMGTAGVYFPHDALMARRTFINGNEDFVRGRSGPIPKGCTACSPIRRRASARCASTRAPATRKSSMWYTNTPSITSKRFPTTRAKRCRKF